MNGFPEPRSLVNKNSNLMHLIFFFLIEQEVENFFKYFD